MRDDDGRVAPALGEASEERHHLAPGFRVEVGRRLVGQQQPRLVGERAGERDALSLARGECAGVEAEALLEAGFAEQCARPLLPQQALSRRRC